MEGTDQATPEVRPQAENLAQTAFKFFVEASRTCPASVTSQAAKIALLTKNAGLDPVVLRGALLADEAKLEAIHRAALSMHRDRRNGPMSDISIELVRSVVTADFTKAQRLSYFLSDEQLEYLSGEYYQMFAYMDAAKREDQISSEAEQMIKAADRARAKAPKEEKAA